MPRCRRGRCFLFGVMNILAGLDDRQRCSVSVANHMALRAILAAVRGIGASHLPPKSARTEQLSNTTLDQSLASANHSSSSNTCHSFYQTPANCKSQSRRQHFIPEPPPSSGGRNSHAQPVRETNKIPVTAKHWTHAEAYLWVWADRLVTRVRFGSTINPSAVPWAFRVFP